MKLHYSLSGSFILLIVLLGWSNLCVGQGDQFLLTGKVTFERKINAKAVMADMLPVKAIKEPDYQKYVTENPQFKTSNFFLFYDKDKTDFFPESPQKMTPVSNDEWFAMVSNDNLVQTDLTKRNYVATKKVFGTTYNLEDSLKKINWKITNEYRTIAGYECRRANAVIRDSIYVVAFYTSEIHVSGGPESFNGLPGMILGLALPHDHVSWFATAVTQIPADYKRSDIAQGKGGRNTIGQYEAKIGEMIKQWGPAGGIIFRKVLIF
ncbi:GLPGLI family protein [Niabella sp.]|uniref:GLPGLI family protein n=1 Tax=Niabella sp. TaxID=1962976 RepID=UPI0026120143|nr:GLPGLI family protein [Niabella sp.]